MGCNRWGESNNYGCFAITPIYCSPQLYMSEETTTEQSASTGDPVASNPELSKLEQAINAEAVSEDSPAVEQVQDAPDGQAFNELAEKKGFKSVDDLVNAYKNVESQFTKQAQELRDLAKEIRSSTPQKQDDDPFADLPQEQKQALDLLGQVIDRRLSERLAPLQQNLEVQQAQKEINRVRESFPNVGDVELQQAIDVVEKHPSLSLDDAVKIVTYGEAKATQQQQQQKAATTQQKKRAFVESAGVSKSGGDIDYSKLSLEELENILPKAGQFIDYKGTLRK